MFYDYRLDDTQYSSAGTNHIQQDDTSVLFLYEHGPSGRLSLGIVHGWLDPVQPSIDTNGGSVSFVVTGLPSSGEWVVEDDNYGGPSNWDVWNHGATRSEIDWTWGGGRTDGGVFTGLSDGLPVHIDPSFNEEAALYQQHYVGDVASWQLISAGPAGIVRNELDMDRSLTIFERSCPPGVGRGGNDRDGPDSRDGGARW